MPLSPKCRPSCTETFRCFELAGVMKSITHTHHKLLEFFTYEAANLCRWNTEILLFIFLMTEFFIWFLTLQGAQRDHILGDAEWTSYTDSGIVWTRNTWLKGLIILVQAALMMGLRIFLMSSSSPFIHLPPLALSYSSKRLVAWLTDFCSGVCTQFLAYNGALNTHHQEYYTFN